MCIKMSSQHGFTKDSGYAWVILLCAFLIRVIDSVIFFTIGIYILEFLEYFNMQKTLTVTVLVSCNSIGTCSGPLIGYAMKRFGIRPLMASGVFLIITVYVIMASFPSVPMVGFFYAGLGIGTQLLSIGTISMVQHYFDKRRSLAAGITLSGVSCGVFLWPPIVRFLIDKYTWRGSLYILAAAMAQCFVLISLLRPVPYEFRNNSNSKSCTSGGETTKAQVNDSENSQHVSYKTSKQLGKEITDTSSISQNNNFNLQSIRSEIRSETFGEQTKNIFIHTQTNKTKKSKLKFLIWAMYTVCFTAQMMGHLAPFNYFPMKGRQNGIDENKIPLILSVIGGIGIFMRPASGYITDRFINRLTLSLVGLFLCGLTLCLGTLIQTFPPFLAMGVIVGVLQSFYMGTAGAQWYDVFGLENIELGTGLAGFAVGASTLILNPVAGALIDLTGNTDAIFYVFGAIQIFSAILLLIIKQLLVYQQQLSSCSSANEARMSS